MKETLLSLFVQNILPLLGTALFLGLLWVVAELRKRLHVQADSGKLVLVADRLAVAADVVIQDLEATTKAELARASMDGKLSPAEVKRLREVALTRLKESLGEEGLKAVRDVFKIVAPSLDGFLLGFIEKRLAVSPQKVTAKPVNLTVQPSPFP